MGAGLYLAGTLIMSALAPDRLVIEPLPVIKSTAIDDTRRVADNEFEGLIDQVIAVLEKEDAEAARVWLLKLTAHADFLNTVPDFQYRIWGILMILEREGNNAQKAYDYALKAAEASPESRDATYWGEMVLITTYLNKDIEATDALIQLVETAPEKVGEFKSQFIFRRVWAAQKFDDDGVRFARLLKALKKADFVPDDPALTTEYMWFELFRIYMSEGNEPAALSLLPFELPEHVQAIRSNKAYRHIVEGYPAQFDTVAAIDRYISKQRKAYEADPKSRRQAQSFSFYLYEANQPEEALKIVDGALAMPRRNLSDDDKNALPWLYDNRSRILKVLGRHEEAEAALLEGRKLAETMGDDKVSLSLNAATFFALEGHTGKAIKAIEILDGTRASAYGRMVEMAARACTYAQTGEAEKLAQSVAHLKANARDGYSPALRGLLCADEQDVVAKIIIDALRSERERGGILKEIQTFLPPPYPGKMEAVMLQRREAVLDRPDVREAVDAYGFIELFPLYER